MGKKLLLKYFRRRRQQRKLNARKIRQLIITTTKIYSPKITRDSVVAYVQCLYGVAMSIHSFFKRKDGLPNPKGSLSTCLSSQAIPLANKEVEKVTSEKGIGKPRGHTDQERYGAPSLTHQ